MLYSNNNYRADGSPVVIYAGRFAPAMRFGGVIQGRRRCGLVRFSGVATRPSTPHLDGRTAAPSGRSVVSDDRSKNGTLITLSTVRRCLVLWIVHTQNLVLLTW